LSDICNCFSDFSQAACPKNVAYFGRLYVLSGFCLSEVCSFSLDMAIFCWGRSQTIPPATDQKDDPRQLTSAHEVSFKDGADSQVQSLTEKINNLDRKFTQTQERLEQTRSEIDAINC
jgi:signal transduction histidine kinase